MSRENEGRCVSCRGTDIRPIATASGAAGRNATVTDISLANYAAFEGQIITFRGSVKRVNVSQRGSDFALMFEDRSWTKGFKMVVFRSDVPKVGGADFLSGLHGRQLRIRGLLVKHDVFGYEIIVSDRAMILEIA